MVESGRSLCHFDRLPCRRRCCYRYSVPPFCPYCLNRLFCLYCSRSVPLLNLFYCQICWIYYATQLFRPTCSVLLFPPIATLTDRRRPTVLLLLLLLLLFRPAILLLLFDRSVPLFRSFYHCCFDRLLSTALPTVSATEGSTIKSSTARCSTACYID